MVMGETTGTATEIRWADGAALDVPQGRALTARDIAGILGVSVAKAWDLLSRGEIESFKIDASRRALPAAVTEYVSKRLAADAEARRAGQVA
jgi:hypothetical protein